MTESKRDRVFAKTDWQCFYCQRDATTIDHMIPLSRGGSDAFENLVGACESCNHGKANLTIDEYLRWLIEDSTKNGRDRKNSIRKVDASLRSKKIAADRVASINPVRLMFPSGDHGIAFNK